MIDTTGAIVQFGECVVSARASTGCLFPSLFQVLLGLHKPNASKIELFHDDGQLTVERIKALFRVCDVLFARGCGRERRGTY